MEYITTLLIVNCVVSTSTFIINFYGSVISKFYVLKSKCCGQTLLEVEMTEKIDKIVDRAIKKSIDIQGKFFPPPN
jgi:hypothetical protein